MNNWWIDFAFSVVITLLRQIVGDPPEKAAYSKIFLKVFSLIWGNFQNDQRFRAVVGLPAEEEV